MTEIWKDIDGYEGIYQISNLGRVKSLKRKKGRILKGQIAGKGYVYVSLVKSKIIKTCSVHRLVAKAFISNHFNYPEVNHRDEIKTNNVFTNLEWCNGKQNCNYCSRNKRLAAANSKPIVQIDQSSGEIINFYKSALEASKKGNFSRNEISKCLAGKRKAHRGFRWEAVSNV